MIHLKLPNEADLDRIIYALEALRAIYTMEVEYGAHKDIFMEKLRATEDLLDRVRDAKGE